MSEEKRSGITQSIREKLGFTDTRLWKRFSARRLELIDTLDLSSKKASDQEEEIRKVAEMLRFEFHYGPQYFSDFDKLVRAAVQSVRRNRKRSTKTGRNNVKRRHVSAEMDVAPPTDEEKPHFLAEIANINTDGHDSVYDMSYSTARVVSSQDQSRAAIDSLIKPAAFDRKPSFGKPLEKLHFDKFHFDPASQAENEREIQTIRMSLLSLMKRSKSCLHSTSQPTLVLLKSLGSAAVAAISALVFECSFTGLNQTSIDHLQEKLSSVPFQAQFYRSLDPDCSMSRSLDDDTAVATLHTLLGCCIKDFGFDSVLNQLGEVFYRSLLVEYPLVSRSAVAFSRFRKPGFESPHSLTNLAAVASELQSQVKEEKVPPEINSNLKSQLGSQGSQSLGTGSQGGSRGGSQGLGSQGLGSESSLGSSLPNQTATDGDKKQVRLRWMSQWLDFHYPIKNSAPPRFVEIIDNAKQAFKLYDNSIYGLRNYKTGSTITCDLDVEKIFAHDAEIEIEVYSQRPRTIPIYEITSAITPNDERPKFILPPPIRQSATPPVLPVPIPSQPPYRAPLRTNFQPLL